MLHGFFFRLTAEIEISRIASEINKTTLQCVSVLAFDAKVDRSIVRPCRYQSYAVLEKRAKVGNSWI